MAGVISEIVFRLRAGGSGVRRWLEDRWGDQRLDQEFGLETATRRTSKSLGLQNPEYVHYQAISYSDLRQLLEGIEIGSKDVFLDLGAGMGRAVCFAATYPFRAVIGVELVPELCSIARQNIERIRHRMRCREVEIVNCDATTYKIRDDVSVVYLFNPFGGAALETVLKNIGVSAREHPRTIRVLFYGTVSSEEFRAKAAEQAWMRLRRTRTLMTGVALLEYENDVSGGA